MGAIRDCQCPHGQPGGLARRKTAFDRLRSETPDAIFIDCGRLTANNSEAWEGVLLFRLLDSLKYDLICPYFADLGRLSGPNSPPSCDSAPFKFSHPPLPVRKTVSTTMPDPDHLSIQMHFEFGAVEWSIGMANKEESVLARGGTFLKIITLSAQTDLDYWSPEADSENSRLSPLSADCVSPTPGVDYAPKDYSSVVQEFQGLTALVRDLNPWEEELSPMDWSLGLNRADPEGWRYLQPLRPELDLVIVGGGGFVEAEVKEREDLLVVYPGLYGGYVLVLDLWTEDGRSVSRYEIGRAHV
jgi:hypothetical protein